VITRKRKITKMVFFRNDNKLNSNVGLLVCVIVLLVVLLANFDKCFTPVTKLFQSNRTPTKVIEPKPNSSTPVNKEGFFSSKTINLTERNVTINPENKTITVKFEMADTADKGYILVLSKYNNNLEKVGNLDVKITDATIKKDVKPTTTTSATTTTQPGATTTTQSVEHKHESICNSSNICEYTFTNVESKDNDGNLFYYRLGVGRIYSDEEKVDLIKEFKFGSGSGKQSFFRVDNTLKEQKALLQKLNNLEKIKAAEIAKSTQDLVDKEQVDKNGEVKYDVDAYMKMLKPYIGNYPDEFTLNQQKLDELSLGKYLNKSMALGELNVNVDVADIMPKKDDKQ